MKKINVLFLFLCIIFVGAWLFFRITTASAAEIKKQNIKNEIEENISDNISSINSEDTSSELNVPSMEEEETKVPEKFGAKYTEGEAFGLISYLDNESGVVVGNTSESLKGSAMLSPYSHPGAMVILGHCYQNGNIFGKLYLLKENDTVTITEMDGTVSTFRVYDISWETEEYYNSKEGIADLFDGSAPLKLVTCMTKDGIKGRLILSLN